MTEGRIGQAGVEVLYRVTPGLKVSQAGVEYVHRVGTPMNVSQAGIEALHRVQASFFIAQAGVEFLYKQVPCSTSWCQLWTITRLDGQVFRFTSLDHDFEWRGETFQACDSLNPSAAEAVSELDAAGTMDLSGALGTIAQDELYAGLFDGAQAEVWLVAWRGEQRQKLLLRGTFGSVEQGDRGFKVELLGDGAKLMQTPLVRLLQPGCRWQFGDRFCQKDLVALAVAGVVDSGAGQRQFADAARGEAAGYFSRGRVTFTTGGNAGVSAEIKEHAAGGVFTLWPRLPFPVAVGDEYEMTPGCTNLKEAAGGTNGCTAWANLGRYGGFDKVPGGDKRTAAANVRSD